MDEQQVERRPRVVESRPAYESGISWGTKIWISLVLLLATGLGVLIWVLGPLLKNHVGGFFAFLSAWSWFLTGMVLILAIGAVAGLLRKFGAIQVIEDVIELGLRVHQHFLQRKYLLPDKAGRYPVPLDEAGYPIAVPGNEQLAQLAGPAPTVLPRRSARGATVVSEQQQMQQVLPPNAQRPQLPSPRNEAEVTQMVQELGIRQPGEQDVHAAPTVKFEDWSNDGWGELAETRRYVRKAVPEKYNFIDELAMFKPSMEGIFLGRGADGPVILPMAHLWHIVFAGPTGVGKSKILRMVFSQLIGINIQCYLADPHYAPFSEEEQLDWTPIEERLAYAPFRDPQSTADFLEWLARGELEARKQRAYHGKPLGVPIVAGLEELASLTDEYPESAKNIGILLRQARKYRICLAIAAQDLLVKSIGLDSAMIENLRLGYYGGGDIRTAKVALGLQNGESVKEDGLGAGLVYVRTVKHTPTLVRVPWPDNDATAMLCSLSSLPVRELVREPLLESDQVESVYQPNASQAPLNIRDFTPAKVGRQQKPINPEHVQYAREHPLSDADLAKALGITQYEANKMKKVIREEEEQQGKRANQ